VRPYLPPGVVRGVQHGYRAALRALGQANEIMQIPIPPTPVLDLSGVVYLSVANPFDQRKNWQDLISAYLRALGECEDATLVLKLVMPAELTPHGVRGIYGYCRELGVRHRCKLILLPGYLDPEQMRELMRATTYYVSATRAEGANLPLMDALAAGRPGISPRHSAMLDYFGPEMGYVVSSSPEPAPFPFGEGNGVTTWHRLDWQSLHDRFRESYEAARSGGDRYRALSRWGRERMRDYASHEAVWPRFRDSLDALAEVMA
jgi:glycosyltransferase involved in cell wall biosynthesis